jgi:hypothetical protein
MDATRGPRHIIDMQAYKVRVVKGTKVAGEPAIVHWVVLADSADQAAAITIGHLSAGDAVTECEAIHLDAGTAAKLDLSKGAAKQL